MINSKKQGSIWTEVKGSHCPEFPDLLKKETGMNAQDHIHYYLVEEAKNILINSDKSVGEIAYSLGFEYPQYFSKLFKQKTEQTPIQYRNLN